MSDRVQIYSSIEENVIQAGFDYFDAETGGEYAKLGFSFDALRTRRIPIGHILGSVDLLSRDERMSVEMILENVLRRKLVSLGKTDLVVTSINKYLTESNQEIKEKSSRKH